MYTPAKERYNIMEYNRCGRSGLLLPKISLGLWHNFGDTSDYENMRQLCFTAFDNGITQFDLPIITVRLTEVRRKISAEY